MDLIFVSSSQTEFRRIRRELCYFILTDQYLKNFFDVFLFENLPANQRNPEQNYLSEVENCSIYIGLFGITYGTIRNGISATEHEFEHATGLDKDRIIYISNIRRNEQRHPRMQFLIERAQEMVTTDSFGTLEELKLKVMQSLMYWQQEQNRL